MYEYCMSAEYIVTSLSLRESSSNVFFQEEVNNGWDSEIRNSVNG